MVISGIIAADGLFGIDGDERLVLLMVVVLIMAEIIIGEIACLVCVNGGGAFFCEFGCFSMDDPCSGQIPWMSSPLVQARGSSLLVVCAGAQCIPK